MPHVFHSTPIENGQWLKIKEWGFNTLWICMLDMMFCVVAMKPLDATRTDLSYITGLCYFTVAWIKLLLKYCERSLAKPLLYNCYNQGLCIYRRLHMHIYIHLLYISLAPSASYHWYASQRSMINDQINRPISFCAICTMNTWPRESWLCICFVDWLTNQSCLLALEGGDCSQYAVHELSTVNERLYMTFTITFKSLGSIHFFFKEELLLIIKLIHLFRKNTFNCLQVSFKDI